MPQVTTALVASGYIEVDVYLQPSEWVGYDMLEMSVAELTPHGIYTPIHEADYRNARVPDTAYTPTTPGATRLLQGKTIEMTVCGVPLSHTFSQANPYTLEEAADELTAALAPLASSECGNTSTLFVLSTNIGRSAMVQITGGTALADLGLLEGDKGYGRETRIRLGTQQTRYSFLDPYGTPTSFYKYRLVDSVSNTFGPWSDPISATAVPRLPFEQMILGYIRLVDATGAYVPNRQVIVTNSFTNKSVKPDVVVSGTYADVRTDKNGYAALYLVRGIEVTIAIHGTNMVRNITVPTDPAQQTFNMLGPDLGDQDAFSVAVPEIPYATRRTL